MTTWVPTGQALGEIISTIKACASPEKHYRDQAYNVLNQYLENPEFSMYLVHILVRIPTDQIDNQTRQTAGLLLKRNIKEKFHTFPVLTRSHIQQTIIPALADPYMPIRNTIGSLITTIISQSSLEEWPNLVPMLIQCLDSGDSNAISGAFNTLNKLCEDSADQLISSTSSPLNDLIPKFLQFFQHENASFRLEALACMNHILIFMPSALVIHINQFLQGISQLTGDSNNEVRKFVCQSIVILLEVGIQYLAPHLESIQEFILQATMDSDEQVALEACEFWASFCEQPHFSDIRPVLEKILPRLIPVLLEKMCYSAQDIEIFEAEEKEQNETVPDRPEDIKPIFHKSKDAHHPHNQSSGNTEGNNDLGDELSDDDYDDGEDALGEWNLRKCAAAGLDILSNSFGDALLPILLPILEKRFSQVGHWSIKESAILALGAIAEGCMNGIAPHLPALFPYLLQLVDDSASLIRSITCWTLSRYTAWAVAQQDHKRILEPLMEALLKRILDHNKKVQEAACSAFCTLEEEAQRELVPYLLPLLQNLMFAFGKYQAKNLLILYDAIGTLADSVGDALNNSEFISILMPPLIAKWNQLPDDNRELFPLLECLTSVAQALGVGFQVYAGPVFGRCLRLIENTLVLEAIATRSSDEQIERPDMEFLVCSLDLISGMTEGLESGISSLVKDSNLLSLLIECCKSTTPEVLQSGFALIGDLAKSNIQLLGQALPQILPLLVKNLDPENPSVCNNASWAIGEIAIKIGADMEPYVLEIMQHLIAMINNSKLQKNLQENCAITIGRLGYVCPQAVAQLLPQFLKSWCIALRSIRDQTEREHSFLGLCLMIKVNPSGVMDYFMFLCGAIASWDGEHHQPSSELNVMFKQILFGFKTALGDNWNDYFKSFPHGLRQFLITCYEL